MRRIFSNCHSWSHCAKWFRKVQNIYNILIIKPRSKTHNPKVRGSNPLPATNKDRGLQRCKPFFFCLRSFYKHDTA